MNSTRFTPFVFVFAIAFTAVLALVPHEAWAANLYWVGTDGASFATASNWKTTDPAGCGSGDSLAAPGPSDIAIFDADCDNGALMSTGTVSVLGFDLKSGYTGTVNSATATVGIGTSGFVQAGGTFTATSGTMTITDGPVTISGGTFTHSSGTVTLAISSATALTLTGNGSSFYNLTVSKPAISASATTLTLADSFTVANDLTLDAVSSQPLTIIGSSGVNPTITVGDDLLYPGSAFTSNIRLGSSTANDNITINLAGDLFAASPGSASGYIRANITFNGTADQTIYPLAAMHEESGTWTGNKAGGNILLNSSLTTEGNFSISSNTFNINDSDDWTIQGTFTQSGGTFTSTSGTVTIYNTFNKTAGTFTHNSGTVKFLGNTNSFTITTTGTTFNNVTFDITGIGVSSSTMTLADSFTVAGNLVMQNQHSSGLNINIQGASSVNPTVTVQGNVSLPNLSAFSGDVNVGTSSATTNFTINVEGNYSQADSDVVMWATLIMGGSGTHTWSKSAGAFNSDFKVNKSGGEARLATAFATATANQDVIIEEGTFDVASFNLTVNSSGSTLVVQDGGVLQLQGDETITANASNPQLNAGSTVTYDGTSGPYTVKNYDYHHLRFNGSGGTFNLGATESVAGNLTISAGTFDISGFSLTVTGTFSNDDTFRLQGGETTVSLTMDVDSGLTVYDGTGSYTGLKAGNAYYNLTFDGSGGTWTLNAALDVDGDITLTNGTLDVSTGNRAVSVAGDWNNSATFTPRSGTVTLDGADQTLTGATTFYRLTRNVVSAATLTLPASTTQTISNTLTLGGASGALLSLRSSITDTQAELDAQGTRTLSFLDVKDNNNINSTVMDCSTSCTDSLNNTNWSFDGVSSSNTAPTATAAHSFSQATDGTGFITFKTTLADADADITRLKVEYATNLGDWEDPTLDSVTASRGSASLSNGAVYQISSIDTNDGDTELTIVWKSKSQLSNTEDTTVYIRLIPNDSTADGGAVISDAFTVDNKAPVVTKPTLDNRTATSLTLKWVPGTTDVNFQHYTLCYGTNATDVNNCNNTAKVWTTSNDSDLATQTTDTTTITGLTTGASYRILLRGHDAMGNVSKVLSAPFIPLDTPLAPVLKASDIRDTTVALYWNRIQEESFISADLCYSETAARVGSTCNTTKSPNPAVKKTITSPTVLSAIISNLKASTTYYFRLYVHYVDFATKISNRLTVVTCPPGQQRVNNVCRDVSPPSPTPSPAPIFSPGPSPAVTPTPTPSPESTTTPVPSDTPSPTPTPESDIIGSITETVSDVVETIIETVTEVVQAVIEVITNTIEAVVAIAREVTTVVVEVAKKVIAIAREIITSPRTGIPQARAALKPIVEQPAVKVTTTVVTAAAVVSVAAQASVMTSAAPSLLSQIPQAASRLWQGILGLFGFRRKRRPWGRVVDASTGEAVGGAYVQVFDHQTKKLQNTMMTNAQGAFSSLVPPGMYEFRVHKPGWTLTPQAPFLRLVAGERIYDGKPVGVTAEKVLPLVLALRMTEAVPLTHHLVWRKTLQVVELFIARLSWPLLAVGALLNSAAVFVAPTAINIIVEVVYAVLIGWKLHLRFKQRPAIGFVRDAATHRPLDLALVRLYDAVTGKLLETRTTTAEGKFLLLPSPGVYTISVVREGYAPYREAHVVVNPKREALALAFTLNPLPMGQLGVAMGGSA